MINPTANANGLTWTAAQEHLTRVDPTLAEIIAKVGPCTLSPRKGYFSSLAHAMINQQISTAAARSIWKRFRGLFPSRRPNPRALLALTDAQLRAAGISPQKTGYLRSLAQAFASGGVPVRQLGKMSDEEVIQALLPIKGIGRWTAEMFLIFVLNRTDLLPVDDLGLCNQARRTYGFKKYPTAKRMIALAEKWRPYRSIATWYLWRGSALIRPVLKPPLVRSRARSPARSSARSLAHRASARSR